jgi:hypothetical protein
MRIGPDVTLRATPPAGVNRGSSLTNSFAPGCLSRRAPRALMALTENYVE